MSASLHSWQVPLAQAQMAALLKHRRCISALGTGFGKTYLSLDNCRSDPRPTIVICPKIAKTNWKRVAESFGVELTGIVNPERISLGRCPWYDGLNWKLPPDSRIIWDEVDHGASGESSKATLALLRLARHPGQVLLMSATLADTPLKLRGAGYMFGLHAGTISTFRSWCLKNGCFVLNFNGVNRIVFTKTAAKAQEVLGSIRSQLGDRMISMRVEDVPGFPETQIQAELYDLSEVESIDIKAAYAEMDDRMKRPGAIPLVEIQHARERAEFCKTSLLTELAKEALAEGLSVVLFVNFRSALARLVSQLGEAGITNVSQIHGGQKDEDRQNALDRFQDNTNYVCCATTDAGGTAISLHDTRHERRRVSYLTPHWSAAITTQALGRIRRDGGTPTIQTFVLAAGTVEEEVYKSLQRKLVNITTLNHGALTDSDLIGGSP